MPYKTEIRLFAIVKNEATRLPFFIKHYQDLGVDRFIFIDNNSTDKTRSVIKQFPNTYCIQSSARYSYITTKLINIVLHRYGTGHFCLVVDADETLILGDTHEHITLKDLAAYAFLTGKDTYRAILLDVYSDQPLHEVIIPIGESPLKYCHYFDPYPRFSWNRDMEGGMRERLFNLPTVSLTKNPFFFNHGDKRITWGTHTIYPKKYADVSLVLFHSKYSHTFPKQARMEAERKQHWSSAIEYRHYAAHPSLERLVIKNEESVRYVDYQQLLSLKMACRSPRFLLYLYNKNHSNTLWSLLLFKIYNFFF